MIVGMKIYSPKNGLKNMPKKNHHMQKSRFIMVMGKILVILNILIINEIIHNYKRYIYM